MLLHERHGIGDALAVEVGLDIAATTIEADELADALLLQAADGAEALAAEVRVEEEALFVDAAVEGFEEGGGVERLVGG